MATGVSLEFEQAFLRKTGAMAKLEAKWNSAMADKEAENEQLRAQIAELQAKMKN